VQDRHYDRHDYMPQKRTVLETWNTRLDDIAAERKTAANVVLLTAAA
jgi:hypothetical protein